MLKISPILLALCSFLSIYIHTHYAQRYGLFPKSNLVIFEMLSKRIMQCIPLDLYVYALFQIKDCIKRLCI